MASRSGLSLALMLALVGASLAGCAQSTSQMPSVQVPISSVSAVAGKWAGTVRRDPSTEDDWVDLTIKDDGTYELKSFRTFGTLLGSGKLTLSNGTMTSETQRAHATFTLHEGEGKRLLKVDGALKT